MSFCVRMCKYMSAQVQAQELEVSNVPRCPKKWFEVCVLKIHIIYIYIYIYIYRYIYVCVHVYTNYLYV